MCDPLSVAGTMVALQIAGGTFQAIQENEYRAAARKSAKAAYASDIKQLELQAQQVDDNAAQDILERVRQSSRRRAQLAAAQAAAGIEGKTADRQLIDTYIQAGYDTSIYEQNRRDAQQQIGAEMEAAGTRLQSRLNQNAPKNPFLSALQIGTNAARSGLDTYATASSVM